MADDNLLAALTGFSEGVSDVLVPYLQLRQKSQIEGNLLRQRMGAEEESALRKYRRETVPLSDVGLYGDVLRTGVIPSTATPEQQELRVPTSQIGAISKTRLVNEYRPSRYGQYAGSGTDLANKALTSARLRVSADMRTMEGSLLGDDEIQ